MRALILLVLLTLLPGCHEAGAATVTLSSSTCANSGSGNDWSGRDRTDASDNRYATVELNDWETSEYLQCTDFGFALPAGAAINGITVGIERSASAANAIRDYSLKIVKDGARTGTEMAATGTYHPATDGSASYGGASALWGTTWSASDINADNFGVALSVEKGASSGGDRTASVDHIAITVDYADAGPASPASLVARYRFEETAWNGSAGELNDSAGHADGPYDSRAYRSGRRTAYPAAASGSPALASDPGTCAYAELGGSGYFRVDNLDALSTANGQATSAAFWLYWNGTANQAVLHWNSSYGLVFHNGKFGFTTFNRSGSTYDMNGVASAGLAGGWHHVVAVFVNGSPAAGKIYIDGVPQTLAQSGSTDSSDDLVDDTLYIGADDDGDWRLSGRIDELKLYDGELSDVEVAALRAETHACTSGCASVTGTSPIQFVAAGAPASVSSSTVASLSFNKPAGTVQNDVMVAQVAAYRSSSAACATIAPPSGWTESRTDVITSGRGRLGSSCTRQSVFHRVAGASEPGSFTFTLSASAYATGSIASYRGADPAAPVMTGSGQTASGTGNITAPSVTITRDGAMLLGFFAVRDGDDETITPPACMTERVESATGNSSGITLDLAESPWGTTGATGSRVASVDDTDANIGQMVVLQPPAPVLAPGAYNVFDTTTAAGSITGNIQTKVAGTAFNLAIVALNAGRTALYGSGGSGFSGTVKVELLGNTGTAVALDGNNCPTTSTVLQSGTLTFAAGDGSRKNHAFAEVAVAWRNVRVRVSHPATGTATTIGCSTDNFALRPASLAAVAASDASWTTTGTARTLNNTGATGGVVHAAGQPFTLRATAVNSAGATTSQYDGAPGVTLTACPLPLGCAVDGSGTYTPGSFNAGTWVASGGQVTSTDASYGETGAITLQLVDAGFASVDASDGSAADCSGRHVCSAATSIGRFVPDHFELSTSDADDLPYPAPQLQTFGAACAGRSFTYVGQPFGYLTAPRALVLARDAGGSTTANYQGFDAGSLTVTVSQDYGATTPASPALDTSAAGTPTITANDDGSAELALASAAALKFVRGAPVAPFTAALSLSIGVTDASEAGIAGNGTIASAVTADYAPIGFDSGDAFRYGRLRVANATGSELLALPVALTAQYWDGQGFVANPADACTSLAAPTLTFHAQSASNQLASGETVATYSDPLVSGTGNLRLSAPGAGNFGYLDVGVSAPDWLRYNWDGTDQGGDGNLYDDSPRARAAFGRRQGSDPVIIRREIY